MTIFCYKTFIEFFFCEFQVIVAKQFAELKTGDRFYFENGNSTITRLSLPQLDEIRNVTLASIMCNNLDLDFVQKNAFVPISNDNPLVNCQNVAKVNLNLWQNEPLSLRPQNFFNNQRSQNFFNRNRFGFF